MLIGGLQKTTLLDYPGLVACTVFTLGCNFKCPFCHNSGLVYNNEGLGVDKTLILNFLSKRKGILDGVCITGGEPLLYDELEYFIKDIKTMGFKVKLDTNGSLPDKLEKLIKTGYLDYIAMDIKTCLDSRYDQITGARINLADIRKSIKLIQKSGIDHEFRTTVVKPFHETEDLVEIAKMLGRSEKYFLQNFVDSGHCINAEGLSSFSEDELNDALKQVQKYVPHAAIRGQ